MSNYGRWPLLILMCLFVVACEKATDASISDGSADSGKEFAGPPFAVGSSTFFIHDDARVYDKVAGINTGVRSLITEIWYPVEPAVASAGNLRRATYGDYVFGNRQVHRLMMTETTFFHLTPDTVRDGVTVEEIDAAIEELFLRERQSWVDAPLATGTSAFPVVVMSHGDAGSRYNMETVSEYLASHGYVVIAPEHTGNSPYSMTGSDPALASDGDAQFRAAMAGVLPLLSEHGTYGSRETYGQTYAPLSEPDDLVGSLQQLDRALLQRLNDLRATLDTLDEMNADGRFSGRLALDRIGLIGRSFGGATTLVGLAMEPRFTAGFAVVPVAFPDPRSQLPPQALTPAGQESVLLAAEGETAFTRLSKPTFLLSGAEDALIIGVGKQQAAMSGTEIPSEKNPHPTLRALFEQSDQKVFWGLLANSNHSTFGVSGGYWWPELKPDTARRALRPQVEFDLIDVALAHRMQQQKALAFFDLTIRQDPAAGEVILDDSFAGQGLVVEAGGP